jgi:hypothetical protein
MDVMNNSHGGHVLVSQVSGLAFVGSKISGFNVTIVQNGVGCLLTLLLPRNGHARTTHGTQKGELSRFSVVMLDDLTSNQSFGES